MRAGIRRRWERRWYRRDTRSQRRSSTTTSARHGSLARKVRQNKSAPAINTDFHFLDRWPGWFPQLVSSAVCLRRCARRSGKRQYSDTLATVGSFSWHVPSVGSVLACPQLCRQWVLRLELPCPEPSHSCCRGPDTLLNDPAN